MTGEVQPEIFQVEGLPILTSDLFDERERGYLSLGPRDDGRGGKILDPLGPLSTSFF